MECLEFRRRLLAEPDAADPAFLAHRNECAACRAAAAQARAFESTLHAALAVPVPDGLAERVLLRQTTAVRQERFATWRRPLWQAAAAIALAVGVLTLYGVSRPARALPDLAVAHLVHEPYALTSQTLVDPAEVAAVFRERGMALHGEAHGVNYVTVCALGDDEALHSVVQEPDGPVTVYFVFGREEARRTSWQRGGMYGRSVPLAGGTLVLLASADTSFDALEHDWRALVGEPTR